MIFYSTLSGLPTIILLVFTLVRADALRSSYTGYLERSKALCLQGNWFCAPIMHKKRNAPPHICLCILFFLVCSSRECRKQEFVNIMCIKVSVKSKIAQTCSYRHRDS